MESVKLVEEANSQVPKSKQPPPSMDELLAQAAASGARVAQHLFANNLRGKKGVFQTEFLENLPTLEGLDALTVQEFFSGPDSAPAESASVADAAVADAAATATATDSVAPPTSALTPSMVFSVFFYDEDKTKVQLDSLAAVSAPIFKNTWNEGIIENIVRQAHKAVESEWSKTTTSPTALALKRKVFKAKMHPHASQGGLSASLKLGIVTYIHRVLRTVYQSKENSGKVLMTMGLVFFREEFDLELMVGLNSIVHRFNVEFKEIFPPFELRALFLESPQDEQYTVVFVTAVFGKEVRESPNTQKAMIKFRELLEFATYLSSKELVVGGFQTLNFQVHIFTSL